MNDNGSVLPRIDKPWRWLTICAAVLVVGLAVQPERALSGLLTGGLFGVQIAIGAVFWIAMLTVSGAKWWLPVRRHFLAVGESLIVPAALTAATAIAGMTTLYAWAVPGAAEHSHLLHEKEAWLNPTFFGVRAVIIVAIWGALVALLSAALRKWMAGTAKSATGVAKISALTIVLGALTISVAFWDWAMSLEPEWFSTMYGVYGFAGALQGGIAAVAALSIHRARTAGDQGVTVKVRHDFGRLLFGFSFFWGYIWFCQFMLIWYANLPEEIGHYATRMSASWGALFWMNVIMNFALPFLLLLPAGRKRHEGWLLQVSLLVVIVRLLDVYLLVEPSLLGAPSVPVYHVAAAVLVVVGAIALAQSWSSMRTLSPRAEKRATTS